MNQSILHCGLCELSWLIQTWGRRTPRGLPALPRTPHAADDARGTRRRRWRRRTAGRATDSTTCRAALPPNRGTAAASTPLDAPLPPRPAPLPSPSERPCPVNPGAQVSAVSASRHRHRTPAAHRLGAPNRYVLHWIHACSSVCSYVYWLWSLSKSLEPRFAVVYYYDLVCTFECQITCAYVIYCTNPEYV